MIEMINQLGQTWMEYFALAVIQNTVFLLIVCLALYIARNATAQVRYIICLIGILKLLVPPFLPAAFIGASEATISGGTGTSMPFVAGPSSDLAAVPLEAIVRPELAGILFVIWIAVVIGLLLAAIISTSRLSFSLRGAVPVPDAIEDAPRAPGIRIFKSDKISMPITVGIFPKKIFVPESWDRWSDDCRRTVIRHETAHITRYDGLAQVFEILAQAFYFFHPLVWFLNRRLALYREMACDDSSAGIGRHSRLRYSRNLVEIAETVARDPFACESVSALVRRKNELLSRIRYQMKEGIMHGISKTRLAIVLTVVILAILPLSWYQSTATPDKASPVPGKTASEEGKTFVDVSVTNAALILIDGKKTNLDNFGKSLAKVTNGKEGTVIINMSCENDLSMNVLFQVQKTMVDMDLNKVSYQSDVAEAMPLVLPGDKVHQRLKSIPEEDIAVLYLKESGDVYYHQKKVEVDKLHTLVKKHVSENDKLIVRIKIDKDATYNDFTQVLHEVKVGGAKRIVIN